MVKALALAMAASGAESDGSDDSERYSAIGVFEQCLRVMSAIARLYSMCV